MYVVRFSTYRVEEYSDPQLFQTQVGSWLEDREAENSYILCQLPTFVARARQSGVLAERLFALKDGDRIVAAGILFWGGHLCLTWASRNMVEPLVDALADLKCNIHSVYGPAHLARQVAESWADRTDQRVEPGSAERVYQLTHVANNPPPCSGRLEQATPADAPFLLEWIGNFAKEAHFAWPQSQHRAIIEELLRAGRLHLWKDPHPVSMASWTSATTHGMSINFVYTPPEVRGRGYAKATVAALASQLLAGGYTYCFIHTDTQDHRSNKLYQTVGAHSMCELLHCSILPVKAAGTVTSDGPSFAPLARPVHEPSASPQAPRVSGPIFHQST